MTDYVLTAADSSPPGSYTGYQQFFSGTMEPPQFDGTDIVRFEHDLAPSDMLVFQIAADVDADAFETAVIFDSEQGELTFNSVDAAYSTGGGVTSWSWPNPSPGDAIFLDGGVYNISIGDAPTPPVPPEPDVEEPEILVESAAAMAPFNFQQTVISQYANSPTLLRLIENMAAYIDPRTNFQAFYDAVWNIDTAVGFGLDIWGKIVGVPRLLRIPNNSKVFGFSNEDIPPDWAPFNQGTFNIGANASQAYLLPDSLYRTLILTKALANIVATTAASLNQLLRNLFPGRGRAYVADLGGMQMTFVFEFEISAAEYAILTQSGAMPHPAGVGFNIIVVPSGVFGFAEAGSPAEPFDQGVFYRVPS